MPVELLFVGDLMLSAENPARYFDAVRPLLTAADVAIGHLEWPHTDRGQVCVVDIPAPPVPVAHLDSLAESGFAVMTMAGNHMFDQGPNGIQDSIEGLRGRGIAAVGAGMTISEARTPAIVERQRLRVGFLSYNAVGPRESWATAVKAGVAPVRIINHYELDIASPGSAPAEHTSVDLESADALRDDIEALASQVDIVCVSFHKGMGFIHAQLAQYERALTRIAVDAGADVVIGHHAHILRGVEVYRGKPIFHGINHFVAAYNDETDPRSPKSNRPRPKRAPSLDFFVPDTEVRHFPFPKDARHTMIARVLVDPDGVVEAGFIPCYLDLNAYPVPYGPDDEQGQATVAYVDQISQDAGLEAGFDWKDGTVNFLDRNDARRRSLLRTPG